MSIAQAVAQHLPFLRRYARALTGSQASGDAYVSATLEALIEDPSVLDDPAGSRVALYRMFTTIWNSVSVNNAPEPGDSGLPGEQRLVQITPRPRQAFLLISLEGFSEEDASKVLDTDVGGLRDLVEEAGRELAVEIATDVLIIEDETFIAMDLEGLVQGLGHKVLGVARTHNEAVALAKTASARIDPRRYSAGGRKLGVGCGERTAAHLPGAGDLHHSLSGAFLDRRASGAGVPDREAVPAGDRFRGRQPSAVLRAQRQAHGAAPRAS